jgi:hypothetical protein
LTKYLLCDIIKSERKKERTKTMKKELILNIACIISFIFLGWIVISTLQVGMRIGTPGAWNFWNIFLNLMKWRMAL